MNGSPGQRQSGVLVVDDDITLAQTLKEFLEGEGYPVEVALSAAEARAILEANPHVRLALVDMIMPDVDGLTLLDEIHGRDPDVAVLMMTGYGTIETAVEAIKRGAEDYLTKPFDYQAIQKKVARLLEVFELRERVAQLESTLACCPSFENFISVSRVMQKVIDRAHAIAAADTPVLITGDTGTGKEMLARAVHAASRRSRKPFVPVNCGALPRELVESELFGTRRGAFTGASIDTPGIFASAAGGTVFLDEIGEMPKEAQVKLLRVLQQGELRPVGSATAFRVDVRVISATNRPVARLREESLRDDLYFRIGAVVIEIPPLRARREDILVLTQHFLARMCKRDRRNLTISRSGLELLLTYSFPGNVRELENMLEAAAALSQGDPHTITERDLKPLLADRCDGLGVSSDEPRSIEEVERLAVQRALRVSQGNRTKAASILGISRDTLYRKLRQIGGSA
jgi:DNA-binding NtrC family response regulator